MNEKVTMMITYNGKEYNDRHGGPFDRGAADSYYGRGIQPHYYTGASFDSTRLEEVDMSEKEIADYMAGHAWNEQFGDKKSWG
jgi:hypothetical protein